MNIVLETDAYASGSGIVIGGIREHLRLIPLAEGELNEFISFIRRNVRSVKSLKDLSKSLLGYWTSRAKKSRWNAVY